MNNYETLMAPCHVDLLFWVSTKVGKKGYPFDFQLKKLKIKKNQQMKASLRFSLIFIDFY